MIIFGLILLGAISGRLLQYYRPGTPLGILSALPLAIFFILLGYTRAYKKRNQLMIRLLTGDEKWDSGEDSRTR